MITGKELIEKMYSENEEIQEEKLYSTGDDYLDDLLEKAFCEGYEYAQKEFARAIPKVKGSTELTGRRFINSLGSKEPYFDSHIDKSRYLSKDIEGKHKYIDKMINSRSVLKGGASRNDLVSNSLPQSQGRKARRGNKLLQLLYDHGETRP